MVMVNGMKQNCLHCEKSFNAKRESAMYCSSRCRTASHRAELRKRQYSLEGLETHDEERYDIIYRLSPKAASFIEKLVENYGIKAAQYGLLACLYTAYDAGVQEIKSQRLPDELLALIPDLLEGQN